MMLKLYCTTRRLVAVPLTVPCNSLKCSVREVSAVAGKLAKSVCLL
jgi:hypothetical protein